MMANEAVRKIGFTGSTAVGKLLMAGAASTVKVGNAPSVDRACTSSLGAQTLTDSLKPPTLPHTSPTHTRSA